MFYHDDKIVYYEQNLQFDLAINHLETLFNKNNDDRILATLIGNLWYYLTEGDINCEPISYSWAEFAQKWAKYINVGLKQFDESQIVNFTIGYTLQLDWIMLPELHDSQLSQHCLLKSSNIAGESNIHKFILWYTNKKKRTLELDFKKLFPSNSLLDMHFRELLEISLNKV